MKKIFIFLCAMGMFYSSQAQNRPGKKYINFGYVSQKISAEEQLAEFKSDFGAFYSSGKTYFVHPKPIANLINIGIDVTFFDATYAKFSNEGMYSYEDPETGETITEQGTWDMHKAELGLQVGPSVHVTIPEGPSVSGYLRYAPAYSMMYEDDEFSGGFGSLFTSGLTLNYKVFGVGVESRWGKAKHSFSLNVEEMEEQGDASLKQTYNLSGMRVFLALRF